MKKNILIIDDSALMRRVLSDIINSDDRFQVADIAVNGLEGFQTIQNQGSKYDAVLLDINMPLMSGIEVLSEIKKQKLKATIIVVSTIAKRDGKETILALELGAFDFVTKPESYMEVKSNQFSNNILSCLAAATKMEKPLTTGNRPQDLIDLSKEKLDMMDQRKAKRMEQFTDLEKISEIKRTKTSSKLPQGANKLVALACSTGGPKALHTVIPKLPENLDAGMLIVQHMPQGFTKSLADRLNELSKIRVKEAEHGDIIEKGTVYIAKGGCQMRLERQLSGKYMITVTKEPARNGLAPCADIMYESLLTSEFDQITCVVLTGMGQDGTSGIKQLISKKNIYVIAQNEETSTVYGMPKVVKESGLVDEVVPLIEIPDAIIKNVGVF